MRAAFALCLLLGGCGGAGVTANQAPDYNQVRRLSTPEKIEVDPDEPARPQPLTPEDLFAAGIAQPACDFSIGDRLLFVATEGDALARVGGTLLHFAHSTRPGPTGGFFEDRQVSVSIGRTGPVAPLENARGEGVVGRWPARITFTQRRADAQVELTGIWRCG